MAQGGFIYAIGAVGTTYVKIGSTHSDVQKRLKALQAGHHTPLQILAVISVETDRYRIEKQIHMFLAATRKPGEWFDLSMDTERLAALVTRASQWVADFHPCLAVKLGDRVRKAREHYGMSQAELARRIHISKQAMWQIENNKVPDPGVLKVLAIADVLHVSLDALCGRKMVKGESEAVASSLGENAA